MGKQKKQKSRRQRNAAGPYAREEGCEDVSMEADGYYSSKPLPSTDATQSVQTRLPTEDEATGVEAAETAAGGPSRHVYKRQAVEWRKMKSEVAQLKRQRQKLRKKNVAQREERKKLGKLIKSKIFELRQKHDAELQSLGLSRSVHDTLPEEKMDLD